MKNITKKLTSTALLCLLGLASCGGDDSKESSTSSTESAPMTSDAPMTSEAAEDSLPTEFAGQDLSNSSFIDMNFKGIDMTEVNL